MGLRDALDAVGEEALALDAGALRQITVDIPTAVITVRAALPALQQLRPDVVAAFREVDLGQYDKIELYTRALTQANGEYLATSRGVAQVPALTEELKEIRTTSNDLLRACFWGDESLAGAARQQGLDCQKARYLLKSALALIGKMLQAG